MSNPYKDTIFTTQVQLHPSQLDNDFYNHLKRNLKDKLEGKCYRNYGYIVEIYAIKEYSEGKIISDNGFSPVLFNVTFSCKLCNVIKDSQLICRITTVTEQIIRCENGPISIYIPTARINKEKFLMDNNNNLRLKDNKKKMTNADYVKITIDAQVLEDGNVNIVVLGNLDDIATEKETKMFLNEQF